jgi:hypothetical protein
MKQSPLCPQLPRLGMLFEPTQVPAVATKCNVAPSESTWLSATAQELLADVSRFNESKGQ